MKNDNEEKEYPTISSAFLSTFLRDGYLFTSTSSFSGRSILVSLEKNHHTHLFGYHYSHTRIDGRWMAWH